MPGGATIYRVLAFALWGFGVPFALDLRPGDLPGSVATAAGKLAFFATGGLLLACVAVPRRWLSPRASRSGSARLARLLLGFVPPVGVLLVGYENDDAFLSVALVLLSPALAALLWSRMLERALPLAFGFPFLVLGNAAFALEVGGSEHGAPTVFWGLEETFGTFLPAKPPYIGPGGRLRPSVDVYMRSREIPQGARMRTNSEGFRNDEEIPPLPAPGELRILSLGDSVSTGMQIEQDEFFGPLLERELGAPVRVVNAEVSDPAYGLHYLQDHGMARQPDVVLYGLCSNDVLQADGFCGEGRRFRLSSEGRIIANPDRMRTEIGIELYKDFAYPAASPRALGEADPGRPGILDRLDNGRRKLRERFARFRVFRAVLPLGSGFDDEPAVMPSYASRYERADGRMRLFDGTANLAYFYRRQDTVAEGVYSRFFELLGAMERVARSGGSRFVLVLHPQRFQVHAEDWEVIRDYWCLEEDDFDLESYNRRIREFCDARGILCCDLLPAYREAAEGGSLFLPEGDMHPNAAGHAVAARAVAEFLRAGVLD